MTTPSRERAAQAAREARGAAMLDAKRLGQIAEWLAERPQAKLCLFDNAAAEKAFVRAALARGVMREHVCAVADDRAIEELTAIEHANPALLRRRRVMLCISNAELCRALVEAHRSLGCNVEVVEPTARAEDLLGRVPKRPNGQGHAPPKNERAVLEAEASACEAPASPASALTHQPSGWPAPLEGAAYQGLTGEIVRAIEPHTEADAAALLLQVLAAFGALVGRGPHRRIEGDEHPAQLYVLLVGETAKARKGTAWGRVREVFAQVPDWPETKDGLSSGEGLKWAVRDATEDDPGIADKRLLVVESEFAQVLRQASRAGNTLSAVIRSAWDTGRLATLTRHDPVTATGAHISIIGHITADELRRELTMTDTANGFANRFLFTAARRSRILPFGGGVLADAALLAERVARAAATARKFGPIEMTEAARHTWANVYPPLSQGHLGLFGAATARSEAQCLRLALMYALLDEAERIDLPHLLAALAVWDYCEASARYIFGSALGDPLADELLRALRAAGPAGKTRTEIRDLFGRNKSAERIGAALELLARSRLAVGVQRANGGRPAEVWTAL